MVTAYLAAACEADDGVDAEQSHLLETRGAALMMQLTGILPTTTTDPTWELLELVQSFSATLQPVQEQPRE